MQISRAPTHYYRVMEGRACRIIMGLAVFLLASTAGQAQPIGEHLDSIEWMSSDSSLIVRGTIVDVATEDDQENYSLWHTVSFRVDETLKGKPAQKLTFIVQTNTGDKSIAQWKQDGRQLLAFLEESRCVVAVAGTYGAGRYARFEFAPRNGYPQNSFLELGAGAESKAYDLTLRPTKSPEATILVVKKAVMAFAAGWKTVFELGLRSGPWWAAAIGRPGRRPTRGGCPRLDRVRRQGFSRRGSRGADLFPVGSKSSNSAEIA